MDSKPQFAFTVFIATFNRAATLPRAFASIERQPFRDFEVIIVDDGSTDGTGSLVTQWRDRVDFPVIYHRQTNQGYFAAQNKGAELARGKLFVLLDSDDVLAEDALGRMKRHWESIPAEHRDQFAGIEGLCVDQQGNLVGDRYPYDRMESDYFKIRYFHRVGGDKKGALRVDILRQYPYPRIAGERFIRPDIVWKRIAERYRTLYVNEVFQIVEYRPDGLTASIVRSRLQNPGGFRYYYREEIGRPPEQLPWRDRLDAYHRFIRYSLHCGISLRQQWSEAPAKTLWLAMLPKAFIKWTWDRARMARLGLRQANSE